MSNGIHIGDPYADSPKPNGLWELSDDVRRLSAVQAVQIECRLAEELDVLRTTPTGQVTVALKGHQPAARRGEMLRRFEAALWEQVSPGLHVLVQPEMDRNRLRQLRGVKVKDA